MGKYFLCFACGFSLLCSIFFVGFVVAILLNRIGLALFIFGVDTVSIQDDIVVGVLLVGVTAVFVSVLRLGNEIINVLNTKQH